MTGDVHVALWQGAGVPGDAMATAEGVGPILARAAEAGARIILFPEGYLTGYFVAGLTPRDLADVERALARVAALAREHRINVLIGSHLNEGGILRNGVVAFSDLGEEVGRYFKRALFGTWEQGTFGPGDAPLRLEMAGLRLGVLICYDVEFPELVRAEAQAGVDLIAVSTALMEPHERVAQMIVPVRAMENQVFVAYANRIGSEGALDDRLNYVGLSSICGPGGEICASAGKDAALLIARVSRNAIADARRSESYLADLAALQRRAGSWPPTGGSR